MENDQQLWEFWDLLYGSTPIGKSRCPTAPLADSWRTAHISCLRHSVRFETVIQGSCAQHLSRYVSRMDRASGSSPSLASLEVAPHGRRLNRLIADQSSVFEPTFLGAGREMSCCRELTRCRFQIRTQSAKRTERELAWNVTRLSDWQRAGLRTRL